MRDSKKRAQAQAQERETERPEDRKVSQAKVETQERLNKIFWTLVYIMSGSRVGYKGKIRMVLDKYYEPSIIFSFSDPEDLIEIKRMLKKQFFKISLDAGLLWEDSVVWEDKEGMKKTIKVELVGYRLKYRYLRRFNSAGQEKLECDRWDFTDKLRDMLIRVEEMYTLPFLSALEDEEKYRRAVLDATKDF